MNIQALYELYVQQKQKISTDTRKIESECLYFALKGDNFDGNAFAHKAIESGAFKAVIDDATYAIEGKTILVDDVLITLQGLANHHRKQFKIPIIGIAGSNGKTTTKELIAAVLRQKYKTHATAGNFNNHIGVPLTLLYMPLDTEMAVIEMGANRPGEVEELCQIVAPNYGVVTSLGLEHIEGFGSFEMVVKTECELYDYLHEHKGMLFVNGDDAILMEKTEPYKNRFVFGTGTQVDVVGKFVKANPYVEFKWETAAKQIYRAPVVSTSLIGNYNMSNLLVAASFGRFFSVN